MAGLIIAGILIFSYLGYGFLRFGGKILEADPSFLSAWRKLFFREILWWGPDALKQRWHESQQRRRVTEDIEFDL